MNEIKDIILDCFIVEQRKSKKRKIKWIFENWGICTLIPCKAANEMQVTNEHLQMKTKQK